MSTFTFYIQFHVCLGYGTKIHLVRARKRSSSFDLKYLVVSPQTLPTSCSKYSVSPEIRLEVQIKIFVINTSGNSHNVWFKISLFGAINQRHIPFDHPVCWLLEVVSVSVGSPVATAEPAPPPPDGSSRT